jgi:hypothetical protein
LMRQNNYHETYQTRDYKDENVPVSCSCRASHQKYFLSGHFFNTS